MVNGDFLCHALSIPFADGEIAAKPIGGRGAGHIFGSGRLLVGTRQFPTGPAGHSTGTGWRELGSDFANCFFDLLRHDPFPFVEVTGNRTRADANRTGVRTRGQTVTRQSEAALRQ